MASTSSLFGGLLRRTPPGWCQWQRAAYSLLVSCLPATMLTARSPLSDFSSEIPYQDWSGSTESTQRPFRSA